MRAIDTTFSEEEVSALEDAAAFLVSLHNLDPQSGLADNDAVNDLKAAVERISSAPVVCRRESGDGIEPSIGAFMGGSPCGFIEKDSIHAPAEEGCRFPGEHHEFKP